MTEEELAAALGLTETEEMRALRPDLLRLAPRGEEKASPEFVDTLSRFQQFGETVVDAIRGGQSNARAKAQIGLILLSASVRRDITAFNKLYAAWWAEDLNDALIYAGGGVFEPDIAEAIERLLAAGPVPRNN
jgi:hypothetical protein